MPYTALPDRRMPYDNDGTLFGVGGVNSTSFATCFAGGIASWRSGADLIELNDYDYAALASPINIANGGGKAVWLLFPESREVTAYFTGHDGQSAGVGADPNRYQTAIQGSNDTTSGVDGTWETASLPSGFAYGWPGLDQWRAYIRPISFTGGKRGIRLHQVTQNFADHSVIMLHVYGEKVAGQTPDDIIYINHDDTPGVEYTAEEDFGDQPLGTTVVRQFRVKNASATKTANTINIQCNDSDFAISTDNVNWVVTINIASLAAGAESATMYVRCTTPSPGALLGPRFSRIVTTVASYT